MRNALRLAALGGVLIATLAATRAAASDPDAAGDYATVYERLGRLVGTWRGAAEGRERSVWVTYHLTGRGSALVETFYPPEGVSAESTMSSVYHLDGEDLIVTHYCGAQNQPRMKASSYDPDRSRLRFEFVDITNLSRPSAYYTREVELTLPDADHLTISFNGEEEGEAFPATYHLTRTSDATE